MKIFSFYIQKKYLIHPLSEKASKSTVVNQTCHYKGHALRRKAITVTLKLIVE